MTKPARRRPARVALLLFVGTLLLQSAWILTLPPFRGTDEFDHAYRAAEVAGGVWKAERIPAQHGRGDLIAVPRGLVSAAHPICASYEYTGPDNCSPVRDVGNGKVLVGSGAAAYNPVYYWVVGLAGLPFDGYTSFYAMRVATALLCALLVALAGWTTALWARTLWPVAGLIAAITPVMGFSISILSPNGVEMCAALILWSALLGLATPRGRESHLGTLLTVAGGGATALTTLRSIGPLWVVLVVGTAVVLLGRHQVCRLVRRAPGVTSAVAVAVSGATVAAVLWTRTTDAARLVPYDIDVPNVWTATLEQVPLWLLQGVAAFPRRGDAAPLPVYLIVLVVLMSLVAAGFVLADRRLRTVLLLSTVVSVFVPFFLTVTTIRVSGPIWQGRYGIPFHLGLMLLATLALDRLPIPRRFTVPIMALAGAALATAHVLSMVHVLHREAVESPLAGSTVWIAAPAVVVAMLTVSAFVVWGGAVATAAVGQRLPGDGIGMTLFPKFGPTADRSDATKDGPTSTVEPESVSSTRRT
jgi:hypothetical protein